MILSVVLTPNLNFNMSVVLKSSGSFHEIFIQIRGQLYEDFLSTKIILSFPGAVRPSETGTGSDQGPNVS